MPVVRAGTLVGVVSERDLLRASLSNLTEFASEERRAFLHVVEIARVMSTPPIVIDVDASIEEAARVMAEHKIGCLPVMENETPPGARHRDGRAALLRRGSPRRRLIPGRTPRPRSSSSARRRSAR